MHFLGIDFGWCTQPSGLCCLSWQDQTLYLRDLTRLESVADVLSWVDCRAAPGCPAGIAVDAPTLIPNLVGMRLPDRLAHRYFGKYHAGCYPANLASPFAERTLQLGRDLQQRGFDHAPTIVPQQPQRFQIEVFPHPAIVHLFGLERILKYKKGRLADRQVELGRLRQMILTHLTIAVPSLAITATDLPEIPCRGSDLKAVEDQLDSLLCAYVAAHWWYWGIERNQVLGDRVSGYIVVPQRIPPVATAPVEACALSRSTL